MSVKRQIIFAVCLGLLLVVVITFSFLFEDKLPLNERGSGENAERCPLNKIVICFSAIYSWKKLSKASCASPRAEGSVQKSRLCGTCDKAVFYFLSM